MTDNQYYRRLEATAIGYDMKAYYQNLIAMIERRRRGDHGGRRGWRLRQQPQAWFGYVRKGVPCDND